jgi:hypothetical protein
MNIKFPAGGMAVRLTIFVLSGLWGQSLLAANNVVQVGNCQSKTGVATITLAVAAVSPGGLILVCPGTYPEQVEISKPLTIRGIQDGNNDAAIIVPPVGGLQQNTTRISPILTPGRLVAAQILVDATTGWVNISNLTVDGTGNGLTYSCGSEIILAGIYYRGASGTVKDVATRNQAIVSTGCDDRAFGMLAESGGSLASPVHRFVDIEDSSLRSFQSVGIAADDFGLTASIEGNTLSSLDSRANSAIQMVAVRGSAVGNSISLGGNDFSTGILDDGVHAALISKNTVGHGGSGIAVASDDGLNSDADDSKIIGNTVFDSIGDIDLPNFNENAGILVCSNNNQLWSNEVNGSKVAAVFVDTCFNTTFGSTGNTIKKNDINEACAGVLLNTAGNITHTNEFTNVVHIQQNGSTCSTTLTPVSPFLGVQSGITRRRGPQ